METTENSEAVTKPMLLVCAICKFLGYGNLYNSPSADDRKMIGALIALCECAGLDLGFYNFQRWQGPYCPVFQHELRGLIKEAAIDPKTFKKYELSQDLRGMLAPIKTMLLERPSFVSASEWIKQLQIVDHFVRIEKKSHAEAMQGCPPEDRPELEDWRDDLFELIEKTPNLDWLLLTKRPENVLTIMHRHDDHDGLGGGVFFTKFPDNVWIGTSVENQKAADERIPHLMNIPAKVRFLSCEPLLGPVVFPSDWLCPSCGPIHSATFHETCSRCGAANLGSIIVVEAVPLVGGGV